MSCSDAIQAYLQSELKEETYVILPKELWLPGLEERFGSQTRVVVRLRKSLYGHPQAVARVLVQDLNLVRSKGVPGVPNQLVLRVQRRGSHLKHLRR